jgi:hypothetical protein
MHNDGSGTNCMEGEMTLKRGEGDSNITHFILQCPNKSTQEKQKTFPKRTVKYKAEVTFWRENWEMRWKGSEMVNGCHRIKYPCSSVLMLPYVPQYNGVKFLMLYNFTVPTHTRVWNKIVTWVGLLQGPVVWCGRIEVLQVPVVWWGRIEVLQGPVV